MPLEFSADWHDEGGITIPYPENYEKGRTNAGFRDIRGRPDLIPSIHEVTRSPCLRQLLERLAQPASPIFSIGCDLGSHTEDEFPPERRRVAGGYLQILSAVYQRFGGPELWLDLCQHLEEHLLEMAGDENNWIVRVYVRMIQVNLDGYDDLSFSATINFFALSPSEEGAISSREALIAAIDRGLNNDAISVAFASLADDQWYA